MTPFETTRGLQGQRDRHRTDTRARSRKGLLGSSATTHPLARGHIAPRVPALTAGTKAILDAAGAIVATSANLSGGPDPRTLAQVPLEILRGVAAAIDGGELPGTPSTVLDITGAAPVVLREGALSAVETLRLLAEATASHHTILTP